MIYKRKLRHRLNDLASIALAASISLSSLSCGKKNKKPTAPIPPDQEITEVTTTVKSALGDTISTTDIDGKVYSVMIPQGVLSSDAAVTLRKSDINFSLFENVKYSTKALEVNIPVALNDSIFVEMPISGDSLIALSYFNGYYRYENFSGSDARKVRVSFFRNSAPLSTNSVSQTGEISTWVEDVVSQPYVLNTNNIDLTDPNNTVVLELHGFAGNPCIFRERASNDAGLSLEDRIKQDFPVIMFQYPTEKLPSVNAFRLKQEFDKLGQVRSRIYIVAYSMGGIVAREFVNFFDTNHITKKIVFLGTPNNGIDIISGQLKDYAETIINLPRSNIEGCNKFPLVYYLAPGPRSLLRGSPELNQLNLTRGPFDIDYFFIGGTCTCPLDSYSRLNLIVPAPNDGLVSFNSLDMNTFTFQNHEIVRLHPAVSKSNLNHHKLTKNIDGMGDLIVQFLKSSANLEDRVLITAYHTYGAIRSNLEIYETDLNFNSLINRTMDLNDDYAAVLSLDKTKVAWYKFRNNYRQLMVANSDFSNPVALMNLNPIIYGPPSWSPTGNNLLFEKFEEGNVNIYRINVDGTSSTKLTNMTFAARPFYSPDGTHIVFNGEMNAEWGAYVMDSNGNNVRRLNYLSGPAQIRYSPNGTKLVYTIQGNDRSSILYVGDSNGSSLRQVTSYNYFSVYPIWSPDSRNLMFIANKDSPNSYDVYTMNDDGTNIVRRTFDNRGYYEPYWFSR